MRKFWYCLIAVILVGALTVVSLVGCKNKTPEEDKTDVIDEPIKAEGIALNWEEVLMVKGTAITLAHTVSPDGATGTATYTSSDTEVAQVNDQGLVSALKAGVATVKVEIDSSHYAECRVIVGDVLVTPKEETAQEGAGTGNDTSGDSASGDNSTGDNGATPAPEGQDGGEPPIDNGQEPPEGNDGDGTGTQTGDGGNGEVPTDNGANGAENGGTQGGNSDQSGETGAEATNGNDTADGNGASVGDTAQGVTNGDDAPTIRRTVSGGVKGTTLFDSVQAAVDAAKANDVIVIDKGAYSESVTIGKNVTVMGVENPKLQQITVSTGAKVKLQNLSVVMSEYPSAGEAAVLVKTGAGIELRDSIIETTATGEPEGGYGVLVEKGSQGVSIKNNVIGNFRYGVYICPTDQSVTVTDNRLSNMAVGIGLDLRQENAETNYPTLGKIADNEYNEVTKQTQFFHYGENYEGDFDFKDNEQENASQGNSSTGGEGLME